MRLSLLLICVSLFGSMPTRGYAAPGKAKGDPLIAVDPERLDEYVGATIEARIRGIAADILPPRDLQVVVTAHAQMPTNPAYPYLPSFLSRDSLAHLSNKELAGFIASASVELLLSVRVSPPARTNLEALLKRKLGSIASKLEITSNTLAIDIEDINKEAAAKPTPQTPNTPSDGPNNADAERYKTEASRATASNQLLERERNDAKRELQLLASQVQTAAQDKAKLMERERDDAKRATDQAKSQSDNLARELMVTREGLELKAFLFKNASSIGAIIAGLLGMILLFLALLQLGKQLAGSITAIAGSLSEVGTALANAPEAAHEAAVAATPGAPTPQMPGAAIPSGALTANIESVQNRLTELRTQVLSLFDDRSQSLVLRKISDLLKDPVKAPMAVFGMELLGKEKANAIFKKLSQEAQTQVLESLNRSDYAKPKSELMLEAGEFFQTQLLAEDFYRLAEKLDIQINESMLKLSVEDMSTVVLELPDDALPRFFLYLGPREIAAILTNLRKVNEKRFEQAIKVLPRIADAESASERDPALVSAIQKQIKLKENDIHRPYLEYYSDIIDAAGEALSESLVEALSTTSATVRDHLRNQIVTFGTIFRIGQEQRDEIFDAQPNANLVAFLQMLPDDQKDLVRKAVSDRRFEMMEEDIKNFPDITPRLQKQRLSTAKTRIVEQLKRLRDAGTLDLSEDDKGLKLAENAA